ncbi:hypothetical protein A2W24_07140 [Microgenomates group bacterium RBG_16_45_19]|nr:MAG: hypothetical protein A2W24_07140 [Microgenomates group bacterium RBG_16_45_19]
MTISQVLRQLVKYPGVSGFEKEQGITHIVADLIQNTGLTPQIDGCGNVLAQIGDGSKIMLVEAHLDEVGICLTNRLNNLSYQFVTVGQSTPLELVGGTISITTKSTIINGIIASSVNQPKFYQDLTVKFPNPIDLPPGTIGYFRRFYQTQDSLVSSPALDNRVGCAVLISLLPLLKPIPAWTLNLAFTTQEEQGLGKGAAAVAQRLLPRVAIVIDSAYTQPQTQTNNWSIPTIGQGPALQVQGTGFVNDAELSRLVIATATQNQIPIQFEIPDSLEGYTNVRAINTVSPATKTIGLNIPVTGQDSPCCQASLYDIQATSFLITKLLPKIINP